MVWFFNFIISLSAEISVHNAFPLSPGHSAAAGRFSLAPIDRSRSPAAPQIRSPEAPGVSDGPR